MLVGLLVWVSILIWLATSTWGGLIWAVLWLFGGGIVLGLLGLVTAPIRLLGLGLASLGENLKNETQYREPLETIDNGPYPEITKGRCQACGNELVSVDDRFCRYCGAPMPEILFCGSCGTQRVAPDDSFCRTCGQAFEKTGSTSSFPFCGVCGAQRTSDEDHFCRICGASLDQDVTALGSPSSDNTRFRSTAVHQRREESAQPEKRRLKTLFLGAVGSGWGLLLLFVSLIVALSFLGFLWWLSDLLYDSGWWPLGFLARIAVWLIAGVIALRVLFLFGKGAVFIARWLWRLSDHVVRPKVPAHLGAVLIILVIALSAGGALYYSFADSDDIALRQLAPSTSGDVGTSRETAIPAPLPTPLPAVQPTEGTYWDREGRKHCCASVRCRHTGYFRAMEHIPQC